MSVYQTLSYSFLLIVLLKIIHSVGKAYRLKKLMPPGPTGLPLLGNVFQVGRSQWLRFTEWKEEFGPIFSLSLAGQPVIVLNDFATVADLLDRRSSIYSNRPRFIMTSEIMAGGMAMTVMPNNDLWRRMRRAAHEGLTGGASEMFQPLQEKESASLALHMLQDPERWDDHLRRSAASTMLCAIYGWLSINTSADSLVERIYNISHRLTRAALPGAYFVEVLPTMLHIPDWMAKWKREGRKHFEQDTMFFEELLDDVRVKLQAGTSQPCFAAMLIEDEKKYSLSMKETAWLAGTIFGAGSETTEAAMSVFILAMVLYPDVMRRAQAQIDIVVGRDRLPTFSDRAQLPYIEAMIKEVLRWRPVAPLGLPRRASQDDWYRGHFIPKDTLVFLNVWGMNRDPAFFPDYDEFRPERYLNTSGELSTPVAETHNQGHLAYGSGRRICVGKDVANQTLFMDFATLLWAFDIQKAVDIDGQPIIPNRTDYVDNDLVIRPAPFKCSITPRSSEAALLIQSVTLRP